MSTGQAPFSVCVYCGSRAGGDPLHAALAQQLGEAIGQRGWRLIYGGGEVGLMGVVADATLAAGGTVIGIIPERLRQLEVGHRGLNREGSRLEVVGSMHQRKRRMAELAHAFLALPGGLGTLEELFEAWTWRHLGYHDRPIGLLNSGGFYDPLLAFLAHTHQAGFIDDRQQALIQVGTEPADLLDALARSSASSKTPGSEGFQFI